MKKRTRKTPKSTEKRAVDHTTSRQNSGYKSGEKKTRKSEKLRSDWQSPTLPFVLITEHDIAQDNPSRKDHGWFQLINVSSLVFFNRRRYVRCGSALKSLSILSRNDVITFCLVCTVWMGAGEIWWSIAMDSLFGWVLSASSPLKCLSWSWMPSVSTRKVFIHLPVFKIIHSCQKNHLGWSFRWCSPQPALVSLLSCSCSRQLCGSATVYKQRSLKSWSNNQPFRLLSTSCRTLTSLRKVCICRSQESSLSIACLWMSLLSNKRIPARYLASCLWLSSPMTLTVPVRGQIGSVALSIFWFLCLVFFCHFLLTCSCHCQSVVSILPHYQLINSITHSQNREERGLLRLIFQLNCVWLALFPTKHGRQPRTNCIIFRWVKQTWASTRLHDNPNPRSRERQ